MYTHKANNQPIQEFNTWFEEVHKNSTSEEDKPLKKFTLSLTGLPICSPELERFNDLCSPHIKYLELQISDLEAKGEGTDEAKYFFTTVRMLLENVRKLHVILADRQNDKNYMTTAYIFKSIFSRGSIFTNLKRLRLTLTRSVDFADLKQFPALRELVLRPIYDDNDPGNFPKLFTHLSGIRRIQSQTNPGFLNLKTLDTIGVPKDTLRNLMLANLSLKHLALSLTPVVNESELKRCLNEYRENVKSIKLLRCKTRGFTPFSHLPWSGYFLNLGELELWGNVMTRLEHLSMAPYLMKLRLDYYCFDCPYYSGKVSDGPNVFQDDVVQNSTKLNGWQTHLFPCLQEFITDCKMASYSWNELVVWMPNLRVLEARIPDNLTLLDLCDYLVMLEKLRIRFGSDVDDDGIVRNPDDDLYDCKIRSRGITNLKHLHTFELEVECGQGKLTDKSAELGFLKVESLRYLTLGFTGNLVTEEMEKRLREKIEHVELYRSCSKTCEGGKVERCCEWADFKQDWDCD